MENLRLCAYITVFTSVLVSVSALQSYTYYHNTELGHIRHTNGTVEWGLFPTPIDNSGKKANRRSDGWDTTVKFALAIVDSVQTQAFPYDLLRRILRNEYSKSEVTKYQTNVIVVSAIGGALALAMVLSVVGYILRRCRRGGRDEFLVNVADLVAKRYQVILGFGAALMTVDFIFVLCSMIVGTYAFMGALDLKEPINDAMDDVIYYFEGMRTHYNFIAANSSRWFIDEVLISDCNEAGRLIWETGRDEFLPQINSTFQLVSDLDTKAQLSLTLLRTLSTDIQSALDTVVTDLDSVLTAVHFNLSNAVTDYSCFGCDGSCSGCSAIVPDDIFLNADFSTLPNITDNILSLTSFLSTGTTGTSQDPSYYFLYGIGEQVTKDGNVTAAKDDLIQSLLSWSNAWGNSTNNIIYPNESVFWFDTMRPRWASFYDDLERNETIRYAFIITFNVLTVAVMALTVASVVVAKKRGLFEVDKTGDEDFVLPKRMMGWSLVCQMTMASMHMVMASAGFYTGANLQKAVCQPGETMGAVENVVDYSSAMPGHEGLYLSDVLLGNGTIASIKLADVLTSCSNQSTAYSLFMHEVIVPNLQDDLQNYSRHFSNITETFDRMRVSLPDDTTLVPPEFVSWVGNYSVYSSFNFTLYDNMLNGNVINADVDTYTANLQTIHDTDFVNGGPIEPSKSRLPIAVDLLQGQKANLASVDTIKINLAALFASYVAAVNDVLNTTNQTTEQLLALEPALINMSGPAISRGVDQWYSEFLAVMDDAANTSWRWVGEAAPCQQISDAYDSALTHFCDQYADYQNASWLLMGHTSFFLLTVAAISLLIYRAMPDPEVPVDQPFDVDAKTRILMIESSSKPDKKPIIAIAEPVNKRGVDNDAFNFLDGDVENCASPAPASTTLRSPSSNTGRFQKGGRAARRSSDAWIDSRPSMVSPSGVVLQKNVMSVESLA